MGVHPFDGMAGRRITPLRILVREVMTEIGTHDDQGFRAVPQQIDDFGNCFRFRVTNSERHQRK